MKIKFTTCWECNNRLDVDDDAVEFDGQIFCDRDCVLSSIEYRMDDIEISESDCTEEDEDYRDDEDE